VSPAERDNLTRFDGKRRGFYEVYFIEVQDAAQSTGLWVRYTLRAPIDGSEPVAEVWGMYFDRRTPSKKLALKQTVPYSMARVARDRLHFAVAGCELTHSGCHGAIEKDGKRLSWDLQWDEGPRLVHFPYETMYSAAFPKTKVMSPHFDLRARGSYSAHGETQKLDGVPGQQSHLWGTKHAHRWIWAHANTFKEDSSAVFEGLTAQIKVGPLAVPEMTMYALRYKGVDYLFNAPQDLLRKNESRTDTPTRTSAYFPVSRWIVGGGNDQLRFRGELWADLETFVGVRYTDPDGSGLVCSHSKIANARLEILVPDGNGWRVSETLTSHGAALEFVGREADPRVPVLV
jgi:hypothetical protein